MKTFLFLAEKAELEGKVGAAFGAFGWSGEAPDRIFDTMKNIYKMKMVSGPMRLKSASLGGGLQMAHDYGKEIAAKIEGPRQNLRKYIQLVQFKSVRSMWSLFLTVL